MIPFPIIDASAWSLDEPEQLGRKAKVWLRDPEGRRWLFKQIRTGGGGGTRGEDWSEKIATELARVLLLPTADVELGHRDSAVGSPRGVVSRYMLPPEHALTHGNELLGAEVASYPRSHAGEVPGYTVALCVDVLGKFAATPGAPVPDAAGATFLFAGYLVLDALVGNTDRHHQNWGVVQPFGPELPYLAPTFDHASSLGFQESEARKLAIEERGAVGDWAARARTKFDGAPHPIDVAVDALHQLAEPQRDELRRRVATLTPAAWSSIIERIPAERMSHVDRTFAAEIIRRNREELLDAC